MTNLPPPPLGTPPVGWHRNPIEAHREQRRAPSTIASARAGADTGAVDHHEIEIGLSIEQVVGGPEAGEPGTDDDGIALDRPVERGTVDAQIVGQRVVPQ